MLKSGARHKIFDYVFYDAVFVDVDLERVARESSLCSVDWAIALKHKRCWVSLLRRVYGDQVSAHAYEVNIA